MSSAKVAAAKKVYDDALKAYNTAIKDNQKKLNDIRIKHQEELDEAYNVVEYKTFDDSKKELIRLQNIESERDKLAQEIYVGSDPKSGYEKEIYDKALKVANSFIVNKYGEGID